MSLVEKAAQRLRENKDARPPGPPRVHAAANAESQAATVRAAAETTVEREPVVLDIRRLQKSGLLPPEAMRSRIAREYQRIKRPILRIVADQTSVRAGMNRLMITSANAGEGKSFTSLNLAMSLAQEIDHTVLLVDGDIASPRLTRTLGLGNEPGLMEVLQDSALSGEDVVRNTNMPRLSFMPAGQFQEQATELLASSRMRECMNQIASVPGRIVIFDSSPLLATAEAQALTLHMGQIVLVVRESHTERRAVDSALSLLDQSDMQVSLILNQSSNAFGDEYDGYYGAYGGSANATSNSP